VFRFFLILTFAAATVFAQQQTQKQTKSDKPAEANTIPAGATEISKGTYKHTDANGKSWIYRKTPFGISKTAEDSENNRPIDTTASPERGNPFAGEKSTSSNSTTPNVSVVEEGDSVKFERATPFGPTRWTRKKSELSKEEQELVERSRSRAKENTGTKE
jgi:hypothetical protein